MGASGGTSQQTLWYSLKDNKLLTSRALFKDDASWQLLKQQLLDKFNTYGRPLVLNDNEITDDTLSSVLLKQGDPREIVLAILAASEGSFVVQLKAQIEPLLSDAGKQGQTATMNPQAARAAKTKAKAKAATCTRYSTARREWRNCATTKCVALTFDDGPGPSTTPKCSSICGQRTSRQLYARQPGA